MPSPDPAVDRFSAAIAAGLKAVDESVRELTPDSEVPCREIGRVFDTAILYGAAIWNHGSQLGCATIYRHAAAEIVSARRASSTATPDSRVRGVLGQLQDVLDRFPEANRESASPLGWALRGVFDAFHASRGMEDVDQLLAMARRQAVAVDGDLIGLCLTVAIGHGNELYGSKQLEACAVLHSHTAARILELLAQAEAAGEPLSPDLRRMRDELAPVAGRHGAITPQNAEQAAWDLYEAFSRIIAFAGDAFVSGAIAAGAEESADEYDGFISYRRAGAADAALALRASLKVRGLNVFVDTQSLDAGMFGPRLLAAIERSPSFLVMLTPGSLDRCVDPSDWFLKEIAHALSKDRHIIPILKDGFQFGDATCLPEEIRRLPHYQAISYSPEFFDAMIDRLEKYMRSGMRIAGSAAGARDLRLPG